MLFTVFRDLAMRVSTRQEAECVAVAMGKLRYSEFGVP